MQDYNRLNLLKMCCPSPANNGRPSWVPDFASSHNTVVAFTQHASGFSPASFTVHGNALYVLGVRCCAIREVIRLPESNRVAALRDIVAETRAATKAKNPDYDDLERMEELARSVVTGSTSDRGLRGAKLLPRLEDIKALLEGEQLGASRFTLAKYEIERCTIASAIFESEYGHIGIGPNIVEPGMTHSLPVSCLPLKIVGTELELTVLSKHRRYSRVPSRLQCPLTSSSPSVPFLPP